MLWREKSVFDVRKRLTHAVVFGEKSAQSELKGWE
jgi:hypothetical protein